MRFLWPPTLISVLELGLEVVGGELVEVLWLGPQHLPRQSLEGLLQSRGEAQADEEGSLPGRHLENWKVTEIAPSENADRERIVWYSVTRLYCMYCKWDFTL